jgi:Flp pilus assembly protein TadD
LRRVSERIARAILLPVACLVVTAGAARAQDAMATARALNEQGVALSLQKQFDAAEKLLNQAMALCDGQLHGEHFCVAAVTSNLATIAEAHGDLAAAERLLSRAADVTLAAMGPGDQQYGQLELKLGRVLMMERKFAAAEPALARGLNIRSHGGDANETWGAAVNLSQVFRSTGRLDLAESVLRQALAVCPYAGPICEPNLRGRLGEVLWTENRPADAETEMRRSADLFAAAGQSEGREAILIALAGSFVQAAKFQDAEALLKEQYATYQSRGTDRAGNIASVEADLARIYVATDRVALAEPMIKSAAARLAGGQMTPAEAGVVATKLGGVQTSLFRLDEGKALLERALATPQPAGEVGPLWWKAEAEGGLGDIAAQQQRRADAETFYRKAADDYAALADVGRNRFRLNTLAAILMDAKDEDPKKFDEGVDILRRLLAQIQAQEQPAPGWIAMVEANLARAASQQLNFKEAESLATDALAKNQALGDPTDRGAGGILFALGKAEEGLGKFGAAETHLRASLAIFDKPRSNPIEVANARSELCEVLQMASRFVEEAACAEQLVAQVGAWADAPADRRVSAMMSQGNALIDQGRYAQARDVFLKATQLRSPPAGPDRLAGGAWMSLGQAYAFSGEPLKAEAALSKAREIFVKVGAGDQQEGIEAARRLGDVEITLGRFSQAEPAIRTSVAWFEAHLGPDHPRTATQLRSLGRVLLGSGRPIEAEPVFNRALAVRQSGPSPNMTLVAQSLADLADCEMRLSRFDQARELYRQAEAAEAGAQGKTYWTIGVVARELGELDYAQGRYADAEANYKRAAPLIAAGGEPAEREALSLQADLGWVYDAQSRYAETSRTFRDLLAQEEKLLGPDDPGLVDSVTAVANLDRNAGRFDAAAAGLKRALEISRKAYGETSPRLVGPWLNLAATYGAAGRNADAEQALSAALGLQRSGPGLEAASSLGLLVAATKIYAQQDRLAEARDYAARALAMARANAGEASPAVVNALLAEADVERRAKTFADAETTLARALAKSRALWGEGSLATVASLRAMGGAQLDLGRPEHAEEFYQQAAEIVRTRTPPGSLLSAYLTNDLALVYLAEDKPAKAETALKPVLAQLTRQGEAGNLAAAYVGLSLARAYAAQNRSAEADAAVAAARKVVGAAPSPPVFSELNPN